jgi:Tfp pilus assembly protein PilX
MRKNQDGYLLLICVFILIVIGFVGAVAVNMFYGSSTSTALFSMAEQAFFTATSGLEEGTRYILTPSFTAPANRITCAGVAGNSNLTNISLGSGSGTFTVTPVSGTYYRANSALTSAVTTTSTSIPVSSTTGFAPIGRIQMDGEIIDYVSTTSTSFTNISRGSAYTTPASHTSGTWVSQYQCSLDVKAGLPSIASPTVTQEIQRGSQEQDAWAAGVVSGNTFVFTHWNNPTELVWTNASVTDATHKNTINGMTMLSNAEGWAVGTITGTTFDIVHYLNGTWAAYSSLTATCNTQSLNAVSAVSSQEAFAVGNTFLPTGCGSGSASLTILRWNGTAWSALTTATTPSIPAAAATNQNLNDVKTLDTNGTGKANLGFAVGAAGFILQYNGTSWVKVTSPTTQALNAVYMISTTEAWAVGAAGVILKWNGTSWSSFTSPTTTALNSIKMIDSNGNGTADVGCAVGNTGVVAIYNGTSWALQSPGGGNLFDCVVFNANDIYAVGAAGRIVHWDGTGTWTTVTSNVTTQLNTAAKIFPRTNPYSNWIQVLP